MGAVGRTLVTATTLGSVLVLAIVTMSGFVLAYPQARPSTRLGRHDMRALRVTWSVAIGDSVC